MDTDDKARPAEERRLATTDERMIVALETIAVHLQTISHGLVLLDERSGANAPFEAVAATGADSSDSERAGAEQASPEGLGIERTLIEHFAVGGYKYTNLAHAIVQAKRDRLNGEIR